MPKPSPTFDHWTHAHLDDLEQMLDPVHMDRYALAIWHLERPRPDELLAAKNIDADALEAWHERTAENLSNHLAESLRHEFATFGPDDLAPAAIAHDGHTLLITIPESIAERRWWYLQLTRSESAGPFDRNEIQRAKLMLRHFQSAFHKTHKPTAGRMLLGHDNRLLLADLTTQSRILNAPDALSHFLDQIDPIREQRFPDVQDHEPKDFIISFAHQSLWVSICRRHALPAPTSPTSPSTATSDSIQWCVELRVLEESDLPALGVLKDPRIALAIAYLHENFIHSPNLNDIAATVHMSPFHFHRLFSRMVGLSPKHYLQRLQLQVARWMLQGGDEPIGNVASLTGFASHGHFTSTFHRRVGESPSEYRTRTRPRIRTDHGKTLEATAVKIRTGIKRHAATFLANSMTLPHIL